ncbi:MAG: thioredoxin [Gammaproteobacteria bacterium]|jgi:putative thioredoxin|nr:thioredoxin [Gammaproteobacteria bacterium]MBT4450983.1 thioredoxin [Gammaproteobacteria bacterium]MBT4861750.1 thioredoxin [Gammaproteobacteria bacterium]MBT6553862.1 thioredoxin [Gammaproteobacteria bacterium]MBT6700424.1 thioredoxin [Gammaproteobacteria bacterium]
MTKINPFIYDIDLEDFDEQVLQASFKTPVLVDFWADWCSPCIAIAPVLSRVIESFEGQVLLAKLEVDEGHNMKLAGKYLVRGFPTIILFKDGEEQDRFSSARPAQFIEHFIQQQL